MGGWKFWGVTKREEEKTEFEWIVQGFSTFDNLTITPVKSPAFKSPKDPRSWDLIMYPRLVKDGVEYVNVMLLPTGVNYSNPHVQFQLSLRDRQGRLGNQSDIVVFGNPLFGFDKFIPWADVVAVNSPWLNNDTLTIHCSLWINGEVKHESGSGLNPNYQQAVLLAEDFSQMLLDEEFSDVTIITVTKKALRAHKNVLAARSKVFAAMFRSPMTEAASGSVEITDFDEDTVKGMLQYIYKGQVDNIEDKARPLLLIAEKYDLPGLKEECERTIAKALTAITAADDLLLAHNVNANILKNKVIEFINRNKDEVKRTNAFQRLLRSNPLLEIFLA